MKRYLISFVAIDSSDRGINKLEWTTAKSETQALNNIRYRFKNQYRFLRDIYIVLEKEIPQKAAPKQQSKKESVERYTQQSLFPELD